MGGNVREGGLGSGDGRLDVVVPRVIRHGKARHTGRAHARHRLGRQSGEGKRGGGEGKHDSDPVTDGAEEPVSASACERERAGRARRQRATLYTNLGTWRERQREYREVENHASPEQSFLGYLL